MDEKNYHWCKSTTKEKRIRYYEQNVGVYKENPLEKTYNKFNFPKSYNIPSNIHEVEIVTFHFNPVKSKRLTETYYEFIDSLKNLGRHVKCYELVFDDNKPEIKNSIVIRGSLERNCLWQKESLINIAFNNVEKHKKYFAWIDHDLISVNPNFLQEAVKKIDSGYDVVQLFDKIHYLDKCLIKNMYFSFGRIYVMLNENIQRGRNPFGSPGGAWIGKIEKLKQIFPMPNIIVGSGDEWFMYGIDKEQKHLGSLLKLYPEKCKRVFNVFREKVLDVEVTFNYIENEMFHLWHGDHKNRQYMTRHEIIINNNFDILTDSFINKDGILETTESKKDICKDIYKFFKNRKEDS